MYKLFGSVNEVGVHNKSRLSDLALGKLWVTQCVWLRLYTTVDMGMNIHNLLKLYRYGVKIDHYENLIDIRGFLERLDLVWFINNFQLILGLRKRTQLSLMRSMTERQFIIDVYFISPVLILVSQRSVIFMTSLSTVIRIHPLLQCLLLLFLSILI